MPFQINYKARKKSFTILHGQGSAHFLLSLCFTNLALQRLLSLTFSGKLNYSWVGKTQTVSVYFLCTSEQSEATNPGDEGNVDPGVWFNQLDQHLCPDVA